jgi:hypothetical protein
MRDANSRKKTPSRIVKAEPSSKKLPAIKASLALQARGVARLDFFEKRSAL